MKNTCLRIALLFPSLSMAGQGVFVDVNNFTGDLATLNAVQAVYWKHGDLGGDDVLQPCESKRFYTEVEGYGDGQWFRGNINVGYGDQILKGDYALAHGLNNDTPIEFRYWEESAAKRTINGGDVDAVFLQPIIGRETGQWNNGVMAHYVLNDGPDQDLVDITILPKTGNTECNISARMFEVAFIDRLPRTVKNHPAAFEITSGPITDVKYAVESGLFMYGWTFASSPPTLKLKTTPSFSSSNDMNTSIETVSDGEVNENNNNTGLAGKFCNFSAAPQTFPTLGFSRNETEKSTTSVKHGWGVDVGVKSKITSDVVVGKGEIEKSITFKYSGEAAETEEWTDSTTITAPSMNVVVDPGKCKQVSYKISHSKVKTDLWVDFEVDPKDEFIQKIYGGGCFIGWASTCHKLFTLKGRIKTLLRYPEDGFLPPQVVVEKNTDPKGPANKVFIRGKADLEAEIGYTAEASVRDVNP